MTWTQADIDDFKAKMLAWGTTKEITFAEQTFTRDDMDAMLAFLRLMEGEVAAGGVSGSNYRLAATSKGA